MPYPTNFGFVDIREASPDTVNVDVFIKRDAQRGSFRVATHRNVAHLVLNTETGFDEIENHRLSKEALQVFISDDDGSLIIQDLMEWRD